MRKLKFRVWDKGMKRMHVLGTNTHDSMNFLDDQAYYYNLQNGCGSLPDGLGTYDLMQYTGLKDSKGKEIYEGDIVKARWGNNMSYNLEVKFEDGGYYVQNGTFSEWLGQYFEIEESIVEVIGNIYEDKYLLEDDKK